MARTCKGCGAPVSTVFYWCSASCFRQEQEGPGFLDRADHDDGYTK